MKWMRWFRPGADTERDLTDELQAHLAMAIRDRVDRGESPEDAERNARREIGNLTLVRESTREVWTWHWLQTLAQDIRYTLRTMRRTPWFTAVAIGSLALGIGGSTAIFSLVDAVLLRRLPVAEPDRLVELLSRYPGEPRRNGFSTKVYEHFRDHATVFESLIGMARVRPLPIADVTDAAEVEMVTGNYFAALGLQPAAGRLFAPHDEPDVAVVAWSMWSSHFNRDDRIVGKRLVIGNGPVTVIGVAPRGFSGLNPGVKPAFWLPVQDRNAGFGLVARLRPGLTIDHARAAMAGLNRWRIDELTRSSKDPQLQRLTLEVEPAATGISAVRDEYGKPLILVMTGVCVLLLIACANTASMLLVRASARSHEMALRVCLGASGRRIVRQVLTESAVLAITGGLAGCAIAYMLSRILVDILTSGRTPVTLEPALDARLLGFAVSVSAACAVIFGLVPAVQCWRSAPEHALRQKGRAGSSRGSRRFGDIIIAVQVALSIVLLTGAASFVRHVSNLRSHDIGFRPESVLIVSLDPANSGYDRAQLAVRYEDLLARLQHIPGVRMASIAAATPISGAGASRFLNVPGFEEAREQRRYSSLNWVAPRYFQTMAMPLAAGRDFEFQDRQRGRVAIVSQSFAQYYFSQDSPLGKHFTFDGDSEAYEIVGVVADAKYIDLHEPPPRTVYLNMFQENRIGSHFVIRGDVPPSTLTNSVKQAVSDVLKSVRVARVVTLEEQMDASIVPERLTATLSGWFGATGAVLAGVGLYGLLAYGVTRRTAEIGLRMAVGATRESIVRMVLAHSCRILILGGIGGAAAALAGMRVMRSAFADVPINAFTPLIAGTCIMVILGLFAALLPAIRAARVDPVRALHHE